jgi:polyhydroxyalkanoate synthesis regulator phasin
MTMSNTTGNEARETAKMARMMRELQSDLADMVASGDLTPEQANEWANMKADQWAQGLS